MSDIDTVAEAICAAMNPQNTPNEIRERMRHDSSGCRRMAQAAIDALGLTPAYGIRDLDAEPGPGPGVFADWHRTEASARRHVETNLSSWERCRKWFPKDSQPPNHCVMSRLVSPWTEVPS